MGAFFGRLMSRRAELLAEVAQIEELIRPRVVSLVFAAVTEVSGVSRVELLGRGRSALVAEARHVACWLLRHRARMTLEQVGKCMAGRGHDTVIHSCKVVERAVAGDRLADLAARAEVLTAERLKSANLSQEGQTHG